MNLRNGASRIGSSAERLPGWRRPVPLSIGAAGLALALALGAGQLGAASLGASATGVERAETKVSTPPDTTGLHPIAYSFEGLAPFSGGLAAVRRQGKWGYLGKNGQVVVPFLYDQATLFDGNWASVRKNGSYGIIDKAGAEVTLPRPLAMLSRFSEGLAAAKAKIGGPWGYVDGIGTFVIQPQFDSADDFSSGLAAVAVQGTWFYVTPSGTIALVTPYYRAYGFSGDGLALVQEKQGGRYGYIDMAGNEVIPPQYPEARLFSQGLAPVRVGDRWGYITTSGATAIPPRYTEAYPFVGGRALVLDGLSSYYFIDSTGERVHDSPFAMAESYSDGVAIVSDGKKYWYVDEVMIRLPIGEAVPPAAGDSGGCGDGTSQGVSTNYLGGIDFFRIVNQTTMRWTVTGANTSTLKGFPGMSVYPGLPASVEPVANAKNGIYTFLHHYVEMDKNGYKTGTYPLFQMAMVNETYTVVLEMADGYKAPPSTTHPWWDWLKYAISTAKAIYGMMSGDEASGALELLEADYDLVSGGDDNQANDNADGTTADNLLTTLTVTKAGVGQLAPLDGGYCGGDSYTVSDGESYVFALKTAKTKTMPPTVQLTITPYSEFFALNAQAKLDMYRKGQVPGVPVPAAPLAGCIYAMAFENYSDLSNNNPCYHPSAFPQYDYFATASKLPAVAALDWWDFANNLNTFGQDPPTVQKWLRTFGGVCSPLPPSCPSVLPMAVSPQSCTQSTFEAECSCVFTVTNANGPIGQKHEPNVPLVDATTDCELAAPFVSPCTITFKPTAGSAPVTIAITDTDTEVPVSLTCTAQKMTVSPLTYSGASYSGSCPFTVQVAATASVSATPATWVTSNTCTGGTSGSCLVTLAVPSGTPATSISLSDGKTTLPISVACKDIPMTLNDDQFPLYSAGQACPWTVGVANAHGPVVVTPASVKTSSTCTGPASSCTVAVSIPYNFRENISFSDGASTVTAPFSCSTYPCTGWSMGLPWGSKYHVARSSGCSVTVPLFCATGAIRFNYAPVGGSVTPITCTPAVQCNAQIWAFVGGTWELHDDKGLVADIDVTCD